MAFVLLCNDFKANDALPPKFTCAGEGHSPPLWWNDAPKTAVSFTVMLVDVEAPGGAFTHWVLFDLPSLTRRLSSGVPAIEILPQLGRAHQAKSDATGKVGYAAPCPPAGAPHRYAFRIFALDRMLALPPSAAAKSADVKKAMQGHVVGSAELLVSVARK